MTKRKRETCRDWIANPPATSEEFRESREALQVAFSQIIRIDDLPEVLEELEDDERGIVDHLQDDEHDQEKA